MCSRIRLCKENIIRSLPVVLFFSFLLSIFAPLEIYLSNKGYFFFEGSEMLGYMALVCIILFVLCSIVLTVAGLIGEKLFKLIFGMFFGGTLALYIQGNWDLTDYGAWNGSEIDWSQFRGRAIAFILVFALLIVCCGIFSLLKHEVFIKVSKYLSTFIMLILVVTLGTVMLTNDGLKKDKEYIATTEEELQLSGEKNMIILTLDAYDSSAFESLVCGNEEYQELFEDFTYYPNTIGGFSSTDMSVPLILTGNGYKNECLFGDYLNQSYAESRLMNWLDSNRWEKDVYFDGLLPQGENGFALSNSKELKRVVSDRKALMNYMYTMVLFRYMPQPIKNHFYFYADNIKGNLNSVKGDYMPYTASNFEFADVIDRMTAKKGKGVFQYIHVEGAHEPFDLTAEFTQSESETSYEDECVGVLSLVDKYLSALRNEGIYDNSILIIMADHGYYNSRQNPLLLVKGYDEHHDFEISYASVSYYDLQDGYIRLLDGASSGGNVFDSIGEDERGRKYAFAPWNTHLNYDTYSGSFSEITFYGNARDFSNYVDDGIEYAEPGSSKVK